MKTDLTDKQWSRIKKYIPRPKTGGRPRTTDERKIINSILYLTVTGCQWRMLCRYNDLPWQTVYRYFVAWRKKGIWKKIHLALFKKVRKKNNRRVEPSIMIIDSQSVRTGKCVSTKSRGYDGGRRVKGRKRHMIVDAEGMLIEIAVTPANRHDTVGARRALQKAMKRSETFDSVKAIYADKGYRGENLASWIKENCGARIKVGENQSKRFKRFVPAKKRWVVERSFSWIRDCRRLTEDVERDTKNSVTFVRMAFIRLMLKRLYPMEKEWT